MGRDDVPRWCEIAIRRSLRHHPEEVAAHVHAKPDPHASHDDAQVDFALVPGRASVRQQTLGGSRARETTGILPLAVASQAVGKQLGEALDLLVRYATSWSRIVRCRTDGTAQIYQFETDEERKRSPGTAGLGWCAPNLDFNGMHGSTKPHPVPTWIFAGSGIWLIALGLYFAVLRPPRLPEDLRFMGTTLALPALVWLAGLASYVAKP